MPRAEANGRAAGRPKPPPKVAFPKKNQPPNTAAFAALLPLPLGRRFEKVRAFLTKQKDVAEDVFFYGPRSGWGLRYLQAGRALCTLLVHRGRPLGIVSLDAGTGQAVDWKALSSVGQKARRAAHGSPALLWLDVPLEGDGASDFKTVVKAKMKMMAKTVSGSASKAASGTAPKPASSGPPGPRAPTQREA